MVAFIEEGLRALPGVSAVGGVSALPFSGRVDHVMGLARRRARASSRRKTVRAREGSDPDYFRVLGVLYDDLAGPRFRTVLLTAFAAVTASLAFAAS